MTEISVIVCTHNGEAYLEETLQSLCDQSLSSSRYDILVIDNASDDRTKDIVQYSFPQVRYEFHAPLGITHARNHALQVSPCDRIAFIDDDARADSHWLEVFLDIFDKNDEPIAVIGGKVLPLWDSPPPLWLDHKCESLLSLLDWGDSAQFLDESKYLISANMALDRRIVKEAGGFHQSLGRFGKSLLSMEEVHMVRVLQQMGHLIYYTPDALVHHHVQSERIARSWLLKRAFAQGRSEYISNQSLSLPHHRKMSKTIKRLLRNPAFSSLLHGLEDIGYCYQRLLS